ncbi:DUF4153 domain-containing protein [Alkalibacter rhizosphaerae]|uniref:DUF4153 domain-containing protein n=1 Tax=Alkalibacter rhizosphaerae TaxID=2815577 RepID=A0A974XDH8_9FIRM|nr:DUF4153 domain-containing protein [Alkalibacter rhizosphaerae]QSX07842.1 DUF4153 domain-containing protein [Alkalibacter rhizosphaerae]
MKWSERFTKAGRGLAKAVGRYPLTLAFLLAAAIVNAMAIEDATILETTHNKLFAAFIVGAFLATLGQVIYEKIDGSTAKRWILSAVSAVLTGGYLWIIWGAPQFGMEIVVRTAALLSAIIIAIILVPSLKGKVNFNQSFLGAFKAFFIAGFFSGVIFAGLAIIIGAVDLLLFSVDEMLYAHTANIVFSLFAPIYFLSLIPNYWTAEEEIVDRTVACPRFLEILISNILIPLVSIFTVILVLYIGLNLRGEFWSENLIEPMLVSYSIVVIVIMFLSANLTNRFATLFRKVFPKVLIPLVVLQLVASVLKIGDVGLTHSRYYVIMYGVFAAVAGVVFSFLKPTKSSIIAMVFMAFSLLSTIPPVDAFGVSRRNQIGTLEQVLERNDMLVDGEIVPKADLPNDDKDMIINITEYIWRMGYTEDVSWLGPNFNYYNNFERTFGFKWDDFYNDGKMYRTFYRNQETAIDISGYDGLAHMRYFGENPKENLTDAVQIVHQGNTYELDWAIEGDVHNLILKDEAGNILASFDFNQVFVRFDAIEDMEEMRKGLTNEEATFEAVGNGADLKVIIESYEMYPTGRDSEEWSINSEFNALIDIKE